ncbi:ATP-binding protein [Actinomadura sp. NPDC023710]|uniref:ATP-binding protein n=1 Tax=Actinomadura sp. NPDC023710 TaxID=3158219 RepID=UPI0033FA5418
MEWSQTYPGCTSMVPAARAFVRGMLGDSPRRHDAELVTAELVANSLRHTPSGDGGEVTVTVAVAPGRARIAVRDSGDGTRWQPFSGLPVDEDDHGRGLFIVFAHADKVGHDADADGQTMWAELTWSEQ